MFPDDKLTDLINSKIRVEMKGEDLVLEGRLKAADDYMNILLENTKEIVEGEEKRALGSVLLRGNNIIYMERVS
ncbi:MAG: Small nuclear ribonucleoprotein [Candidatus Methanohalarchaeum thermophilum]|uniref:Small nuclear ribonucleoprotein n=1 Tax=Methanohalarchaeum thermophilum TaxID=1903181 RepID=A0A1Q6DS51_METT1|nr:MAG: Small nuclear ribonucleoprotein [Candidatus Methanohalarchaeum thermophilum]